MPLHFKKEDDRFSIAIWKMDEEADQLLQQASLSKVELEKLNSFIHEPRRKEWICVRMLLRKLHLDLVIVYNQSGKPAFENSTAHISISHTKNFAGIIVSDNTPVGIDLERINPRIEKIAFKFVSEEEEKFVHGKNHLETLYVIWGVRKYCSKSLVRAIYYSKIISSSIHSSLKDKESFLQKSGKEIINGDSR
jgi:phosphopantetheinyl transferase